MNDRHLAMNALHRESPKATLRRDWPAHHTDEGCTYASEDYRTRLIQHGITCSMSRRGNCYDVKESWFSRVSVKSGYMPSDIKESIVELVQSILPRVADPTGLEKYEPDSVEFSSARLAQVDVPPADLARLVMTLRLVPEIAAIENGIAHNTPSSYSSPVKVASFAEWLLAQSRFRSPGEALSDLLEVVRKNQSPLTEFVAVWGLSPKVRFDLNSELAVVPVDEWPLSSVKEQLQGKRRQRVPTEQPRSFARPGAAIVRTTTHGPLFEPATSAAATKVQGHAQLVATLFQPARSEQEKQTILRELQPTAEEFWRPFQESSSIRHLADEVATVIALLTPHPIIPVATWYERPDRPPIVGRLSGWSGISNDKPVDRVINSADYPIEDIQRLVSGYLSLDSKTTKRLRTPLVRLNQGRRSLEIGDIENAAVDFGIAAEALLAQDREKDSQISYVLRVRGTLLLGGTEAEKRTNYKALRTLYDLRSTIAHEGALVDRRQIPHSAKVRETLRKASEDVKTSRQLCINLMLNVIRRGGFPDWDQLMFGW